MIFNKAFKLIKQIKHFELIFNFLKVLLQAYIDIYSQKELQNSWQILCTRLSQNKIYIVHLLYISG